MANTDITPAAWAKLDAIWRKYFTRNAAKREIAKQPFFGAQLPIEEYDAVHVRVSKATAQAIDDAATCGMGMIRIEPHKICYAEPPVYTLRDICWDSKR